MLKWIKRLLFVSIILLLVGIGTIASVYYHVKTDLPDVASIQEIQLQVPMKVFSIDGELISQFGEKRRIPLTIDEVPKKLNKPHKCITATKVYHDKLKIRNKKNDWRMKIDTLDVISIDVSDKLFARALKFMNTLIFLLEKNDYQITANLETR